ncbi:MAG: hypothetical protein WC249_04355 [Patescibacteria group bacterium]|jgi:hypothetical protein
MKKLLYLGLPALVLSATPVYAICPVCVVAIGAGLGLSEYLGIDDTVAGLWIGGFLVAMIIWTINWLASKNWLQKNKKISDILIVILYYGLVLWPLGAKGLFGHPANQLWGVDKLLLGIAIGSFAFLGATTWYTDIKKKNNNHAQFPYQKVVMPVGTLLILSLIFYSITR